MEILEEKFQYPSNESTFSNEQLVGKRISIFWKGDNIFYPALVKKYDESKDKHLVLYENDYTGKEYFENLRKQTWKIWTGTDEEYVDTITKLYGSVVQYQPEPEIVKKTKIPTYSVMILEAVIELNDKEGSSLNAIRKYIQQHYEINNKQKASFHSLTLKAVNRAVANGELERIKHSFKLTAAERERRKERFKGRGGLFDEELGPDDKRLLSFGIDPATYASILSHNRQLRKLLVELKTKRDGFLRERFTFLKHFLPEHNYFNKAEREAEAAAAAAAATVVQNSSSSASAPTADETVTNERNSSFEENDDLMVDDSRLDESQQLEEDEADENESTVIADPSADGLDRRATIGNDQISPLEAEVIEEEIEDPEDKMQYSTLDGVKTVDQPTILTADLHDHQVVGISWMVHMFEQGMPMILGDQMGLGKTIQTIGFLAYLSEKRNIRGPHLIVVPLSVLSNWIAEVEKFCPTFRAVRFHGPKSERERIKDEELRDFSEFEIVVTTFEILVSEINFFRRRYVWTTVIVDEGHRLKNEKSQLSEKLRLVPCIGKIILTGTPLQNNLHELWALLFYLAPDIFTSPHPFDEGFDLAKGKINNKILRRARKMLSVFMLRRLKDQVSIKLPSRREVTLLVSLTEQQTELYRQLLCGLDSSTIEVVMREAEKEMSRANSTADLRKTASNGNLAKTASTDNFLAVTNGSTSSNKLTKTETTTNPTASYANDSEWRKLMNILLQLRKICNHTYLIPYVAPDPYIVSEEIVGGSGKLLMLDRMLPALKQDGHRVLIFSQFTSMLDILEDYCEFRDYSYVRLDGETNRVKRRLDVRRFNAPNSTLFIFLISTRAGGLGLNLASADTVILYDSDWNPQVDLQAMERAHRIGQKKPVRVFRLICRGSVEERMISRAEKKLFLNAMVGEIDPDLQLTEHHGGENDPGEVMEALGIGGSAMSKGELASLIRFGANAVFESENSLKNQLSDEELFNLLERNGRDKPHPSAADIISSSSAAAREISEEDDAFEKAQAVLKDRMEMLQEVDLRQLGNVIYAKKKPERKATFDNYEPLNEKRQRKERIVMMDGKGTGYGGAVPVLSDNIEVAPKESTENDDFVKNRGRQWTHRTFCTLCGKKKDSQGSETSTIKCAHCPFLFHQICAYESDILAKGSGMFICPHHRCADCNRSTASAGGLLFRCLGCFVAYCEDCLPQDEIESIGRCRELEKFGYHSKQAYYIKCPSCCQREGLKPTGVLGDQNQEPDTSILDQENSNKDESTEPNHEGKDEQIGMEISNPNEEVQNTSTEIDLKHLRSQYMLIQWDEILPPPPKVRAVKASSSKKRKRSSRASNGHAKSKTPTKKQKKDVKGDGEEDEGADDEEEESEDDQEVEETTPYEDIPFDSKLSHPKLPKSLSYQQAYDLFLSDKYLKELINIYEQVLEIKRKEDPSQATKLPSFDITAEFALVLTKIEAGRYRSTNIFANDLNYVLETQLTKKILKHIPGGHKALKERVHEDYSSLLNFLKEEVISRIQ